MEGILNKLPIGNKSFQLKLNQNRLCQSGLLGTSYLSFILLKVMKRAASLVAFSLVALAVRAQETCERTKVAVLYDHTLRPHTYTFGMNQD